MTKEKEIRNNRQEKNEGAERSGGQGTAYKSSIYAGKTHINRIYKSTLFTMLFEERENLLELYNAITGKNYGDPELLEINTLENAIYMSMKNDLSFLIDGRLSLYEHQSTYSPNLPLRFLFYISNLYSGMTKDSNLYGTKTVRIPTPEFVIFYNGKENIPDKQILKLSDMYTVWEEEFGLELKAVMLNICGEHNKGLKSACRTLREYAQYTDKVRGYTKYMEVEEAVDRAIRECIEEDILREFLKKHKAEAKSMSIFEYDQEKHLKMEREEAWEEGKEEGKAEEKKNIVLRMLEQGFADGQIRKICDVSEEELRKYKKNMREV